MLISKISIKRPYFTVMINFLIIIFGLMSFTKLGIQDNPNVDMPFISVNIKYKGVNPKTAEEILLKPMEEQFKGLSNLKNMHGYAFQDGADVFLEFNLNVNIDRALSDVRDKLSYIDFPKESETPKIQRINSNDKSILSLNVSSSSISFQDLSYFVRDTLKPQLQNIEGVGAIQITGDETREIQILLNSSMINAMKISPNQIENKIKDQIVNKPSGNLRGESKFKSISTYNIPDSIDKIAKMPIIMNDKSLIRIEDIATIKDTHAEISNYSELNGNKTITLSIIKDHQGNIVNIAKEIKQKVAKIKFENNNKINIVITQDNSEYIVESYHSSIFELLTGSFFAVLIVFIFLHDWRNTLICAVAIPTSLIGTLAIAHALNFTINSITLMALTLSVGILIDDAIVVIENIHRHKKFGKSSFQAADEGTDEIGLAAIAVTLAIVAVFVPVAFMDGLLGKYFFEFGITVATAVLISLFVAFTIVPMMSSRILKDSKNEEDGKNKYAALFDKKFEKIQLFYQNSLRKFLNYKKTTIFSAVIIFIISIVLLKFVPIAFSPEEDNSMVNFKLDLQHGTPLNISIERGKELEEYIRSYPGVENVVMNIAAGEGTTSNNILYNIMLVKTDKRNFTKNEFSEHLTKDAQKFIRSPFEKLGFGDSGYEPIRVNLMSSNSELMNEYSKDIIKFMSEIPNVTQINSSAKDPIYELRIIPNNLKAADLEVNINDMANTLKLLYGGVRVGDFYANGRYFDIKMLLPMENNQTIADITSVHIPSANNSSVLLSSVASFENVKIEPSISHLNGNTKMTISAQYSGKDLNGVTQKIQEFVNKTKPLGVTNSFSGEAEDVQKMVKTISTTLLLATLFIFMVLCSQFENVIAPFAIMLSVPLAFSGSFIALLITQYPLSIYGMIGIIMLMGLVTKNAILLIEFAQQKLREDYNVDDALLEAAFIRFRPILMTTLTMIAGMLPLLFHSGPGSSGANAMGVTVIGGLISSTLLTLFIVPCAYSMLIRSTNKKWRITFSKDKK
ncbi:efflux RND transporter permease subunit [Silvanigrella aquatica]|uniref:Acriflavin resistance protein n=1 Tax=Silvanigrella aquatica TaxID=1915309 RepID=A0A1L4CX83_9BACT|nr:efflux RND transporter permease subunit [Silvanigrella aquatica]APJ02561.1 hypothetical protein AXG55_00875 [Silvanigrella aquatica]